MELANDWFRNLLYFSSFLVFGMTVGMAGPALMDLLLIYFSNLDVINALAWILFSQSLMRFVGAVAAGVISDRFECNYNALLAVCLFSNAILQVVTPLSKKLSILISLTAISGLFVGVVDTVANIVLISLHGIKVSPYLQGLYFCYGFGAFVSPLIAEPFLSVKTNKEATMKGREMNYVSQNYSRPYSSIIIHEALDKAPFEEPKYWTKTRGRIEIAFCIVGALHVPVMCGLSFVTLTDKLKSAVAAKSKQRDISKKVRQEQARLPSIQFYDDAEEEENESFEKSTTESERNINEIMLQKQTVILITIWTSIVVFIFDGLQGSFAGYIFTYAMEIDMTAAEGAILTSLFWGFLSVGRLLSIPVTIYCKPRNILKVSLVLSLISTVLMVLFHSSSLAIWLGTIFFALSMSNVFPCSLAMVEQYFPVNGTIACAFVVSAAVGETVIPLIVGELFDKMGTIMFMGCAVLLCSLACVSFVVLSITAKELGKTSWEEIDDMEASRQTILDQYKD